MCIRDRQNGVTFPDYVELKNVAGTDVYLQNWSLSDNPAKPRKFNFPAGIVIPSNGYLVVWLDDAAEAPGLHAGFALDNDGDTIALFNPEGERSDVLGFGLQVADHSIGRGSDNAVWTLNQPTPGKTNKSAPISNLKNLKLNEFVAAAPPGGNDWVELYNTDSKPAEWVGLMWEAGVAKFTYRRLSFIAPGGYAVLNADERPGVRRIDFRLPAAGGTQTVPRAARPSHGLDLLLTGRRTETEEALSLGLITRLTEPDYLRREACELAKRLAETPAKAMKAMKQVLRQGSDLDLVRALALEKRIAAQLYL